MEEFKLLTDIIEDLYGISKEKLISKSRKRELVELRYVCANILRSETDYTVMNIGKILNIDHSTVCYAKYKHQEFLESKNDKGYKSKFQSISKAYNEKNQTPERLESKLESLLEKKREIENQISLIEKILANKREEDSKVEPILSL